MKTSLILVTWSFLFGFEQYSIFAQSPIFREITGSPLIGLGGGSAAAWGDFDSDWDLGYAKAYENGPNTVVVNRIIYVPGDYPTIQQAIDNSVSGDTILVAPGTYSENLTITHPLALIGSGRGITVISAQANTKAIHVQADEVTLRNFSVFGKSGATWTNPFVMTAIVIESSSNTTVSDVSARGGDIDYLSSWRWANGGHGMELKGCSDALLDSDSLTGGKGGGEYLGVYSSGDGLRADSCSGLIIQTSIFRSGDCAPNEIHVFENPGLTGAGLRLLRSNSVQLIGLKASGGAGNKRGIVGAWGGPGGDGISVAQSTNIQVNGVQAYAGEGGGVNFTIGGNGGIGIKIILSQEVNIEGGFFQGGRGGWVNDGEGLSGRGGTGGYMSDVLQIAINNAIFKGGVGGMKILYGSDSIFAQQGGEGIHFIRSGSSVCSGSLYGGIGGQTFNWGNFHLPGGPGGHGVLTDSAFITLGGDSLVGASGGPSDTGPQGVGGHGVYATNQSIDTVQSSVLIGSSGIPPGQIYMYDATSMIITDAPPTAPVLVGAVPGIGAVTLRWSQNGLPDVTSYHLYADTSSPAVTLKAVTNGRSDTSITITGLDLDTYYFRVKAVNSQGIESVFSNELALTTLNSAPYVISPVPDTTVAEDFGRLFLVMAGGIFYDSTGSILSYAVAVPGGLASLELSGDSLFLNSHTNAYGTAMAIVTGSDGLLSASDTFAVTIQAVNDPPLGFLLTSPENGSVLADPDSMIFRWRTADDVDGDTLTYTLHVWGNELDTSHQLVHDTTAVIDLSSQLKEETVYRWVVGVTDGISSAVSVDTFTFRINVKPFSPILESAVAGYGSVDLTWTQNQAMDVAGYRVYADTVSPAITLRQTVPGREDTSTTVTGLNLGTYYFRITAVDSSGFESGFSNELAATTLNSAPYVIGAVPDTVVMEDFGRIWVGYLPAVFSDSNNQSLIFSTMLLDSIVQAEISADSLYLVSRSNYNGSVQVVLSASDGFLAAEDTFQVAVEPVNDPPSVFSLVQPLNGDTLEGEIDSVVFTWQGAYDVDGDTLSYSLRLWGGSVDTTWVGIQDTMAVLNLSTSLHQGEIYQWNVKVTDGVEMAASDTFEFTAGRILSIEPGNQMPFKVALHQNYPNPFNPATTIRYDLTDATRVRLDVYNVLGQQVRSLVNDLQTPGFKSVVWDARNDHGAHVSSGVYFYRIQIGSFVKTRKMLLLD